MTYEIPNISNKNIDRNWLTSFNQKLEMSEE